MKAQSRQAPVRAAVSRSLSMPSSPVEVVGPGSALAWDQWIDRLAAAPRTTLLPLAPAPSPCFSHPVCASAVQALFESGVLLPVAPARGEVPADVPAAVASALHTPDICLWSRGPGQDISGLIAEVLRRLSRQALRVLFVAASPAPLERTLAKLASDPAFLAIRFPAPGERSSNGPLTRFGLEEQRAALRPRLLARAERALADLERNRVRIAAEADAWNCLAAMVREIAALDARRSELSQRRQQLDDEVSREAEALAKDDRAPATGPFAVDFAISLKEHRERINACDRVLFPLGDQKDILARTHAELATELTAVNAQLADYRAGRWWTVSYWQAAINATLRHFAASLVQQDATLRQHRERLESEIAAVAAKRQAALDARDADIAGAVAAEVGRRRTEIDHQIADGESHRSALIEQWRRASEVLPSAERPAEPTQEIHSRAFGRWQQRIEKEMPPAGSDLDPQNAVRAFLQDMPGLAPVVAGTTLALMRDPDFAAAAETPFDFVILEDADRLAESDLLAILGKASRALVIGSAPSVASSFGRLWRLLHRAEPPSTYRWSQLKGGYLCTIRPLSAAEERFIETERLADFPEIELRILSMPKSPPRLAQVVFPPQLSARDAKTFIYRELQEASVDRIERPRQLLDGAERFTIAWECPLSPAEEIIELEPGLREAICVHDGLLTTCRIEFDNAAGWDLPKIHDWLRCHLPALDAPRTADVQV